MNLNMRAGLGVLGFLSLWLLLIGPGCGSCGDGGGVDGGTVESSSDGGEDASTDLDGGPGEDAGTQVYNDFPATPEIQAGVSPGAPALFAQADEVDGGTPGPCLVEPALGALFPTNWTPPLFEWSGAGTTNVFELRFHIRNQAQDLVVYTAGTSYVLPEALWASVASHSAGEAVELTFRAAFVSQGALTAGPVTWAKGEVFVAPVAAPGSIVYWSLIYDAGTTDSALKGFTVGAKNVVEVLSPQRMGEQTVCIGCHTSSPDGLWAFTSRFQANAFGFNVDARAVDGTQAKADAGSVTAYAFSLLTRQNQTLPTFSPAHYSPQDAVVVTVLKSAATHDRYELVWTDLHATSGGWGMLARIGDAKMAATPSFSRDGTRIVYTSSDGVYDGRTAVQPTDVYVIPYNDRDGGAATPLPGASDPAVHEYYPVFSPNDVLIAYNRAPLRDPNNMPSETYNADNAEVFVIPAEGGTGVRLPANDPPACAAKHSPGVTNSWPRWSPEVEVVGDRRFYWLVFSSKRKGPRPQLYVAAVVTRIVNGKEVLLKGYPAIYVTSQEKAEGNHTPAWDVFQIEMQ